MLRNAVPVVAGVAAGVLTSLAASSRTPPTRPAVVMTTPRLEAAPSAPRPPSGATPSTDLTPELDRLRARVGQLEARERLGADPAPSLPAAERIQQSRRFHEEEERTALDRHARESADPRWSPRAARSLEGDLERLQELTRGRAVRVDCRTTTCVATMEWATHAEAVATYAHLLHADYGVNCTRSILLHQPEDAARPYQARLVFRCSNHRPALAGP